MPEVLRAIAVEVLALPWLVLAAMLDYLFWIPLAGAAWAIYKVATWVQGRRAR